MNNNKLLVLDMDGVINSNYLIKNWLNNKYNELKTIISNEENLKNTVKYQYHKEFCNCTELIFPELAEKITEIINKTNCNILWSSSWRYLDKYKNLKDIQTMFNRRNLPGNAVIDTTSIHSFSDINSSRGLLIRTWLLKHKEFTKVAVLDDRYDAGDFLPEYCKFFQTDETIGITDNIKRKIILYLNK